MTFECFNELSRYLNRDEWKRLYNHVLALDAICFSEFKSQFDEKNVHRELVKCVCGFQAEYGIEQATIATGNWGCGAFNGDKELKCNFLIFKLKLKIN